MGKAGGLDIDDVVQPAALEELAGRQHYDSLHCNDWFYPKRELHSGQMVVAIFTLKLGISTPIRSMGTLVRSPGLS